MPVAPSNTISLTDAQSLVDEAFASARLATERIPVRAALGRVLRRDAVAALACPPFDKAAMDGYAIGEGGDGEELRLLETVVAGSVATAEKLRPGTSVKVMTGARVPEGTARVVPFEDAQEAGSVVRIRRSGESRNVCRCGEDLRPGQRVLAAGRVLSAIDVANLIASGVEEVEVSRPLRIDIISTGDEVVATPAELAPGKILDANGPLLAALAHEAGFAVTGEAHVPDDRDATVAAIRNGLARADFVVLSGGVSGGDHDFVGEALAAVGLELQFTRVAVKPGRPMTFASGGGRAVFGLPGNPVAVYLTFQLFVRRAAARILGADSAPTELRLPLREPVRRRSSRRVAYLPARLVGGEVEMIEYHGTAHLAALSQADGFVAVPAGVEEIAAGEEVTFLCPSGMRP
jgi:molybdopterin molybdotransferase